MINSLTSVFSVVQFVVEILLTHFSIVLYHREYQFLVLLNSYVWINLDTPPSPIQLPAVALMWAQGGVAKAKYDPMYARSGGFRGLFHFLKLVICRGTGVLEVVGNSVIF